MYFIFPFSSSQTDSFCMNVLFKKNQIYTLNMWTACISESLSLNVKTSFVSNCQTNASTAQITTNDIVHTMNCTDPQTKKKTKEFPLFIDAIRLIRLFFGFQLKCSRCINISHTNPTAILVWFFLVLHSCSFWRLLFVNAVTVYSIQHTTVYISADSCTDTSNERRSHTHI